MRLRRFLPVLALFAVAPLAAVLAWPSPARPQDAEPAELTPFERGRANFHGTWRLEGTQAQARELVDAAIERSVGAMNFFVQGVARDQLRANTPLNRRIDLEFRDGERIMVRFDERFTYTTRMSRTTRFDHDGDEMRVTQRWRGEQLEQVFATDQGTRWNLYTSTGPDRMSCQATTQGMLMPQPLVFTLHYRREAARE
jgi:hypothetical protein